MLKRCRPEAVVWCVCWFFLWATVFAGPALAIEGSAPAPAAQTEVAPPEASVPGAPTASPEPAPAPTPAVAPPPPAEAPQKKTFLDGKKDRENVIDKLIDAAQKNEKKKGGKLDLKVKPGNMKAGKAANVKKSTPFYKHWVFWTVLGVVVFSGIIIGVKYGKKDKSTMSFDVKRVEP